MAPNAPVTLTDSTFDEQVLNADGIVVVDFWAPWCGPCHQMAPGIEAFARANEGKVTVYKLDVDENPKNAERYEIRSVPTVIFFVKGDPAYISRGAMSQNSLQKKLEELSRQKPQT